MRALKPASRDLENLDENSVTMLGQIFVLLTSVVVQTYSLGKMVHDFERHALIKETKNILLGDTHVMAVNQQSALLQLQKDQRLP